MAGPEPEVFIDLTGPLFDGKLPEDIAEAIADAGIMVAEEAVDQIRNRLDINLQNPTGYYRSNIDWFPRGESFVVSDSGVVYGPWLEGVSRRNASSSFKGYEIFRRVRRDLDTVAHDIAQEVISARLGMS